MRPNRQDTFRKITAYLLLVAVTFFFAPKELVHNFFHPDETCDVISHHSTDQQVEKIHEHCDLDQYSVPPLFHEINHFSFEIGRASCRERV